MNGKRGPAGLLLLALALGACTSQQTRDALGFFGLSRKPEVARTAEPPKPPPPAAKPAEEDEPVPVAAPRIPVETDRVAAPPGRTPVSAPASAPANPPGGASPARPRPRS